MAYCNRKEKLSSLIKFNKEQSSKPYDDKNLPSTIVKNFFKWYKKEFSKINSIQLVKVDSGYYRINFNNVSKFLDILKSSGYFSNNYINEKKRILKNVMSNF